MVKSEVQSFSDFKKKFLKRYWGEPVQHDIKRKLEFGCYTPSKDTSRSEYASSLFVEARELDAPITERENVH